MVEADGLFVTALGIIPLNRHISLFGKAGFMNWNSDFTLTTTNFGTVGFGDDGTDPMFGVGAEFLKKERFSNR